METIGCTNIGGPFGGTPCKLFISKYQKWVKVPHYYTVTDVSVIYHIHQGDYWQRVWGLLKKNNVKGLEI